MFLAIREITAARGRFGCAVLLDIHSMPPIAGGLLWPNGFIYAIGFAGLAATVVDAISRIL